MRRFAGPRGMLRVGAGPALAFALTACFRDAGGVASAVEVGRPVPAYGATALAGGPSSLAELRGRVVLLNVWATWCVPCRTELPDLEVLHQRFRAKGLALVGVSIDASADADRVKAFAADRGVSYPLWLDADDRVSGILYSVGVPATYLIGRDGTLLWKRLGPLGKDEPELNAAIARALEEAEPAARG